jgi:phospholipase A1
MKPFNYAFCLAAVLLPATSAFASELEECITKEVLEGNPGRSAADIKALCRDRVGAQALTEETITGDLSAVEVRGRAEGAVEGADYVMTAYHPTYIMGTYDTKFDPADTPFAELDPDFENFKKQEIKYQLSAKALVARDLFGSNVSLYGAYTQEAWWQLFSDEGITSAPFRDINHEPEIFLRRFSGADLPFDGRLVNTDLALVHESNGRSQFLSRSWNRVMARFTLDYGDLALFGRLWYRLPEDIEDDDNPYEYRYLGYGDMRAVWAPNRNTFSLMVRPGTEELATELTWSYPISEKLRVYAQWWNGYGESLIAYDQRVNRFGIGIAINDYLMRDR